MPIKNLNGTDLFFETRGKGPSLVFISGFASTSRSWDAFAEALSDQFCTITLDNRGSGQSSATPPPYSIDLLAQDVIALLDHLNIEKAHMIGASMGSTIVQTIGLKHPERIDKGVLVTPFAKLPTSSVMKAEVTAKLIQAGLPMNLVFENILPWLFSNTFLSDPTRVQKQIEGMVNNPHPQPPLGYAGQLAALKGCDLSKELKKIQTPFLLIAGEEDLSTPLFCAQHLHDHLPNSTLKTLSHVGHMIHVEKPTEVLELIREFL